MSIAYEPAWLKHAHAFPLDPELDLFAGEFFPGNSNFGVFMVSCQDRWGQILMKRRETIEAKEEGHIWPLLKMRVLVEKRNLLHHLL